MVGYHYFSRGASILLGVSLSLGATWASVSITPQSPDWCGPNMSPAACGNMLIPVTLTDDRESMKCPPPDLQAGVYRPDESYADKTGTKNPPKIEGINTLRVMQTIGLFDGYSIGSCSNPSWGWSRSSTPTEGNVCYQCSGVQTQTVCDRWDPSYSCYYDYTCSYINIGYGITIPVCYSYCAGTYISGYYCGQSHTEYAQSCYERVPGHTSTLNGALFQPGSFGYSANQRCGGGTAPGGYQMTDVKTMPYKWDQTKPVCVRDAVAGLSGRRDYISDADLANMVAGNTDRTLTYEGGSKNGQVYRGAWTNSDVRATFYCDDGVLSGCSSTTPITTLLEHRQTSYSVPGGISDRAQNRADGLSCVGAPISDTRVVSCGGTRPANTSASTTTYTQTLINGVPTPVRNWMYGATGGDCIYSCALGYSWDGSQCKSTGTTSGTGSTGTGAGSGTGTGNPPGSGDTIIGKCNTAVSGKTLPGPYEWATSSGALCSSGVPLQGSGWPVGPWTWMCQGQNGGGSSACSVNKPGEPSPIIESRKMECGGSPPANSQNTTSATTYDQTSTDGGNTWTPSTKNWTYGTTAGECVFKCQVGALWDGTTCKLDPSTRTETAQCGSAIPVGGIANTQGTTYNRISTDGGTTWNPSVKDWSYSTTGGECTFRCPDGATWDGSSCKSGTIGGGVGGVSQPDCGPQAVFWTVGSERCSVEIPDTLTHVVNGTTNNQKTYSSTAAGTNGTITLRCDVDLNGSLSNNPIIGQAPGTNVSVAKNMSIIGTPTCEKVVKPKNIQPGPMAHCDIGGSFGWIDLRSQYRQSSQYLFGRSGYTGVPVMGNGTCAGAEGTTYSCQTILYDTTTNYDSALCPSGYHAVQPGEDPAVSSCPAGSTQYGGGCYSPGNQCGAPGDECCFFMCVEN